MRKPGLVRRAWRVVLPVAAGLAVLAAALTVPVTRVHGTAATGPMPPPHPAPPWTGRPIHLAWADGHHRIALDVRSGAECRPVLGAVTSTAPARIEVRLTLPQGTACRARPRLTGFLLPVPSVAEPGQGVLVLVDGMHFDLPAYRR